MPKYTLADGRTITTEKPVPPEEFDSFLDETLGAPKLGPGQRNAPVNISPPQQAAPAPTNVPEPVMGTHTRGLFEHLMEAPEAITKPAADWAERNAHPSLYEGPWAARARGFLSGIIGGAGNRPTQEVQTPDAGNSWAGFALDKARDYIPEGGAAGQLSPANIISLALPLVKGAGIVPRAIQAALPTANKIIGAAQGVQGFKEIAQGHPVQGAINLGFGALGLLPGGHEVPGEHPTEVPPEPDMTGQRLADLFDKKAGGGNDGGGGGGAASPEPVLQRPVIKSEPQQLADHLLKTAKPEQVTRIKNEIDAIDRGMSGQPNEAEIINARAYLDRNYVGKPVELKGQKGVIEKTLRGEIGVRTEDGNFEFASPDAVKSEPATYEQAVDHIAKTAKMKFYNKKFANPDFQPEMPSDAVTPQEQQAPVLEDPNQPSLDFSPEKPLAQAEQGLLPLEPPQPEPQVREGDLGKLQPLVPPEQQELPAQQEPGQNLLKQSTFDNQQESIGRLNPIEAPRRNPLDPLLNPSWSRETLADVGLQAARTNVDITQFKNANELHDYLAKQNTETTLQQPKNARAETEPAFSRVNNEKGAIGDQSGPKNLKELQDQGVKQKSKLIPATFNGTKKGALDLVEGLKRGTINYKDLTEDSIDDIIHQIETESNLEIVKENANHFKVDKEWNMLHGTPDDVETSGMFHDYALDRLRQYEKSGYKKEETGNEPSSMKVPGINPETGRPNVAVGGADERVLDVLGTALYASDRPSTVAKELLQNSIDELKISRNKGPINIAFRYGRIDPRTNAASNVISISDHGRGMGPEDLYTIFTDVGKTGKGNESTAAGGFGFAKAAPLLGGEYVKVYSTVNEGGEIIRYTFEGNPAQLKKQTVGVPLTSEVMPADTKTGFRVDVSFPSDKTLYAAARLVKKTVQGSPGIKDVNFFEDFHSSDTNFNKFLAGKKLDYSTVEKYEGLSIPNKVDTIDTPAVTGDVHYELDDKVRRDGTLVILNNGLFAMSEDIRYGREEVPHVPDKVIVNIKSKVEEGADGYPFSADRERLNQELRTKIHDYISTNIKAKAEEARINELQRVFDSLQPVGDNDFITLDSGERYTPEELDRFNNSPVTKAVGRIMGDTLDELHGLFEDKVKGITDKFGFIIGPPNSGGINIPSPKESTPRKFAVLVNYLGAIHQAADPEEAADRIVHVMMHEFNHNIAREEGAGFTWSFAEVLSKFKLKEQLNAAKAIHEVITDPKGKYAPEVQGLLQEYLDSRGRAEVKKDVLSREAAGGWVRKPEGQEGNVGSSGSNAERVTSAEQPAPAEKLFPEPKTEANNVVPEPTDPDTPGKFEYHFADRLKNLLSSEKGVLKISKEDAMAEIKKKLDESAGIREEQEKGYSKERGIRFGKVEDVKTPGIEGLRQKMGKMAGPLPKEPFAPLKNLRVDTKKGIYKLIDDSDLQTGEKVRASIGFAKLTGEMGNKTVPSRSEIRLIRHALGNEIADEIIMMHGGINAFPIGQALNKENIVSAINIAKSMQATMDFSAALRQGLPLIHTKQYWSSFSKMFKYFGDKTAFEANQQVLHQRPNYQLGESATLQLTDLGEGLAQREELFMSTAAEKIPGFGHVVKGSERAYVGFLNKLRADTFDDLVAQAEKMGIKTFTETENAEGEIVKTATAYTKKIAEYVNTSTGRGSLGRFEKNAVELNAMLFSPRLLASRLQMLNPKYYMDLPPMVRKEAFKSLFSVARAGLIMTGMAKLAGAEVETDPRSADFLKARFGNTRVDPFGGFQQYVVAAAKLATQSTKSSQSGRVTDLASSFNAPNSVSVITDLLEGKSSPVASFFLALGRQKDFGGAPIQLMPDDKKSLDENVFDNTLIKRYIPLVLQDLRALYKDDPSSLPLGVAAMLGLGVQTYNKPAVGNKVLRPINTGKKEQSAFGKLKSQLGLSPDPNALRPIQQ